MRRCWLPGSALDESQKVGVELLLMGDRQSVGCAGAAMDFVAGRIRSGFSAPAAFHYPKPEEWPSHCSSRRSRGLRSANPYSSRKSKRFRESR
jgi:hypothetical protein